MNILMQIKSHGKNILILNLMYPLKNRNVPLGIYVPQFGNPCTIYTTFKISNLITTQSVSSKNGIIRSVYSNCVSYSNRIKYHIETDCCNLNDDYETFLRIARYPPVTYDAVIHTNKLDSFLSSQFSKPNTF